MGRRWTPQVVWVGESPGKERVGVALRDGGAGAWVQVLFQRWRRQEEQLPGHLEGQWHPVS